MKNKTIRTVFSCVLAAIMIFSALPVSASAVSESEIEALRAKRNELSAQRAEKQAIVDELEAEHASVLERKLAMDERNNYTNQQIQLIGEEIALYDEMIKEKAEELDEARALELEQLERYRSRVRAMEENGNYGFIALVLNATDLGELLTTMDDIGEIMESDKELEDQYIAAREHTEKVKADYESTKTELQGKQEDLRAEQAELEKQIEEATLIIRELEEDLENRKDDLNEIIEAEDAANARINQMVAELERQRQQWLMQQLQQAQQQQQQQQGSTGGGDTSSGGGDTSGGNTGGSAVGNGYFVWPCPASTYITSRFGLRVHPVYGTQRSHTGMDIAANSGENVLAADGGTVILAGVNGGYGNCVMIDHGNGYVTLYGHMSSLAVYQGQIVSQGDVIAYVGSTGVSTGPHLHFEVWSGGSRIDPEQFFSGLTFSEGAGV